MRQRLTSISLPDQFNAVTYFIDRHLKEGRGNNVAIEYEDKFITYRELSEKINRFGNGVRSLNISHGERVLLLLPDGPEFAISFFGSIKSGAIPVPVNTLLSPPDYEYLLNDSRASTLVIHSILLDKIGAIAKSKLPHLKHILIVKSESDQEISFDSFIEKNSADLEPAPTNKNDPAFWLYSSGSTGFPKACVHLQHDMVICSERFAKGVLGMTGRDRCFSVSRLFFAYGLGNALYFPFSVGGAAILTQTPPTKPDRIFDIIERKRPTLFFSVPSSYLSLLSYEPSKTYDMTSLRACVSAGEPLPPMVFHRFKKRFGKEILDGIGSTEALQTFISNRPGSVRPGSSGKIVPGYEAKIVNAKGSTVKAGEIGNLLVKTEAACAYYWNQPEKTKATIKGDWLKTGDKYYQDSDGYFWFVGRADDMIKCKGAWVSPVEIENVLIKHSSVLEAAVVGKTDESGITRPKAYIVLKDDTKKTPELTLELEHLIAKLPSYKRPRWIETVPKLPKTATGKIQRFKLRQLP